MTDEFTVRTPLVTPMTDDGSVDEAGLRNLVDHLVSAGVDGLVPCGTTGEFAALTDDERRTVVETTVDAAPDDVPVMAGVGGTAVAAVRRRIREAADAGADSALVVAPYFGGQADDAGNEAFFRAVVDDAALPVVLYDIPSAVGQELSVDSVVSLAEHDAVVGLKDSSGDVTSLDAAIRRTPDGFAVYQGWDAGLVPALAMGADGGINAISHLYPDAFAAVADAVTSADLARARSVQHGTIDPAFDALAEHGFAPVVKAVLAERGVIASDVVRPPQERLAGPEREEVLDALD